MDVRVPSGEYILFLPCRRLIFLDDLESARVKLASEIRIGDRISHSRMLRSGSHLLFVDKVSTKPSEALGEQRRGISC